MKQPLIKIADWLQEDGQHLENIMIKGVSIDSRTVGEGHLFIPFRGEQVNGHRYVKSAIEKGAAAALWMKDEPNPPKDIPLIFVDDPELALQKMARTYRDLLDCTVIGITGSNGKTSTKDLVASVLSPYYNVRKTEGNFNNELGLPLTLLSLDEGTEYAVLEMGMSGFGEISFLSKLAKPDYVIITNIGEAHMQDLGSREGIAKAKFEIIDGLSSNGKLFYDGDEPLLNPFVEKQQNIQKASFGYQANNDLALQDVHSTAAGSDFVVTGLYEGQFTIPVYGAHQVKNALAAILIAKEVGLSTEDIREALSAASLTDMRMQPVSADNGALFINDAYNAAPTSMRAALSFLKETSLRPEKWVVLGDMLELGNQEKAYHESLSAKLIDMKLKGILLYGPRMKWLFERLQDESLQSKLLWSEDDYEPLVNELRDNTDADSVILLKGSRGMALENILTPFLKETNT
ncbi:UDP-N-acetylmuramoyl-tripeptide--D-alanyl-D-alanine ligase [Sporosarcina sp. Marseille-Q4063]|uniref:UDP-N-acetylmuramoyl-tripeptide--D-alanyl-D- alanine ligase n=1 Tax=Sporosarcina sp. Marseille-Q4063 TaxID=2810514 RepID=UPI001BAFB295|nr:UDP-N-acetylmuramoyl-tripeptide--D-alanyl-D-alanine ligase [Sporosarcina sp. Marseille-Q4063]QUW23730.1 UDP-N-acetylmuramoyl-tripeptide--D-alanyl-D-alanine ligase [Sporosarcina sp. Marseille-Q4063]